MNACYENVLKFKDEIDFKFMIIINNKTMHTSYAILSNLYCDPFMIKNEWLSCGRFNKKQYRKEIAVLKKLLNKKVKLVETKNDEWHTRLIYKLV